MRSKQAVSLVPVTQQETGPLNQLACRLRRARLLSAPLTHVTAERTGRPPTPAARQLNTSRSDSRGEGAVRPFKRLRRAIRNSNWQPALWQPRKGDDRNKHGDIVGSVLQRSRNPVTVLKTGRISVPTYTPFPSQQRQHKPSLQQTLARRHGLPRWVDVGNVGTMPDLPRALAH